jgi:hypothetical protein
MDPCPVIMVRHMVAQAVSLYLNHQAIRLHKIAPIVWAEICRHNDEARMGGGGGGEKDVGDLGGTPYIRLINVVLSYNWV